MSEVEPCLTYLIKDAVPKTTWERIHILMSVQGLKEAVFANEEAHKASAAAIPELKDTPDRRRVLLALIEADRKASAGIVAANDKKMKDVFRM